MLEIKGNIWDYYDRGFIISVTTNGNIDKNGNAIMGAGIAGQAAKKFPDIRKMLGTVLNEFGNIPYYFPDLRILTIPTKNEVWKPSSLLLIEKGCEWLKRFADGHEDIVIEEKNKPTKICVTRFGTLNGGLNWIHVKPIMNKYLDDRFICVDLLNK